MCAYSITFSNKTYQLIDKSIVESKYKSLSDEQLLHLFEHEIAELTPEARELLISELRLRKIDVLKNTEQHYLKEFSSFGLLQLPIETQTYISDNLEKGKDFYYLTGGLIERGIEEETARMILKTLSETYSTQFKKSTDAFLRGISLFISGLALQSLPLNPNQHLAVIIISYALMILGLIKLIHEFQKKERLKKLIQLSNQLIEIPPNPQTLESQLD